MNISPIGFAGTTNFQDIISRPQAYTAQPAASTSIKKEGKSHKGLKIAAGIVAAAALAAGGLALVANKTQIFTSAKHFKGIADTLQKAGDTIYDVLKTGKTKAQKYWGSISQKFSQMKQKAGEAAEEVATEAAETIAQV